MDQSSGFNQWLPRDGAVPFMGLDRTCALPRPPVKRGFQMLGLRRWLGRVAYALAYWLLEGSV